MVEIVLITVIAIYLAFYVWAIVYTLRKDAKHKEWLKEEKRRRREMLYK